MKLKLKDPWSAITHGVAGLLAIAGAAPLLLKAASGEEAKADGDKGETESSGEPVTIRLVHYMGEQAKRDALDAMLAAFNEAHPEIHVDVEVVASSSYIATYKNYIAAGEAPDIMFGKPQTMQEFVDGGYFMDLKDEACMTNVLPMLVLVVGCVAMSGLLVVGLALMSDGLLKDGDELKDGYYWHDAENGKYYRSDEQIPVTDDITLEAVKGRYGIKITDEKGVEHLLRQGTYILNLGDCGDIYYATGSEFILTLTDAKLRSIECDMDLTLRLLGSSSIAAKGDEDAIHAGSLCISTTATGDGRLSISAKDGQAYKPLDTSRTYKQESDHVTMPESALNQFERFSFSGGTLTLLGADTETFVNIDRCLKAGKIADGTELRLVNEDGVTVFSKKTPLEDPEDWDFLAINAVHAKKLHLIADGEELPPEIVEPEEPEEPEKPSIEPVLIGGSILISGGDRNPFSDVRAIDWYYDDVMYAYDRGLIRGTAYNKFSPKDSFTRGMLLTILARHDGVRTKDSTPWYASGCDWAARNGISDGKNPEEAVSREEFALTLYRYAQYRGSSMLSGNDLSSFTDASAVSDAALPAVQWAVSEAILRGDNFYLHPQSGATRAEAAAMLHRFFAR